MTAFSAVLRRVHAGGGVASDSSEAALLRVARSDPLASTDDCAFLKHLLQNHISARQKTRDASANTDTDALADFARLRARGLTKRQCEVLYWISEGKRDAEIAVILGCASKTVSKHAENILAKLGGETRLAAVHTAQEWLKGNPDHV